MPELLGEKDIVVDDDVEGIGADAADGGVSATFSTVANCLI